MNLSTFPLKNHYFNIGLESLWGLNSSYITNSGNIIVISLSQWSLRDVVSSTWLEKLDFGRILIISHSQFFPLARYYQLKNKNVIAICEESESVKVLDVLCLGYTLEQRETYYGKSHLTDKEFISLRYALNGVSAKEQAISMGLCTKTAFRFRDNVAKKLQVKKLSHLLCNIR